jgi:hypothetical protein
MNDVDSFCMALAKEAAPNGPAKLLWAIRDVCRKAYDAGDTFRGNQRDRQLDASRAQVARLEKLAACLQEIASIKAGRAA